MTGQLMLPTSAEISTALINAGITGNVYREFTEAYSKCFNKMNTIKNTYIHTLSSDDPRRYYIERCHKDLECITKMGLDLLPISTLTKQLNDITDELDVKNLSSML